jgi:hypothetical protein
MATVLVVIGLIGLFFVLMSVRLILIKGGKFKGTCASQSPYLRKEDGSCGYCGKKGDECDKEGSLVNKVLSKF